MTGIPRATVNRKLNRLVKDNFIIYYLKVIICLYFFFRNLIIYFGKIINGFSKDVLNKLPMEFAVEAQKLLEISLEGSVG